MNAYHLLSAEIAGLKLQHKTLKKKREADRVKAVYMHGAGYAVSDVAFILDLREKTVRLPFLPAYRPNLNPIERLWGIFKKTMLYNKSIEKFSGFQESCRNFFSLSKKIDGELAHTRHR